MDYLGFTFQCFESEGGCWYVEGEDMATQVIIASGATKKEAITDFISKVDSL